MNVSLQNPFAHDTPDSVDAILNYAQATCLKYNAGHKDLLFQGQLIAAGRASGTVAVWDTETKGAVGWLVGHVKSVSAVAWSRNNRFLASASYDCSVIIWDLSHGGGEVYRRLKFDTPVLSVEFDPTDFRYILVVLETHEAVLVDVKHRTKVTRRRSRKRRRTGVEQNGSSSAQSNQAKNDEKDGEEWVWSLPHFDRCPAERWYFGGSTASSSSGVAAASSTGTSPSKKRALQETIATAIFARNGRHIFAGTTRGALLVYEYDPAGLRRFSLDKRGEGDEWNGSPRLVQMEQGAAYMGASLPKEMVLDVTGTMLLVNSKDRQVRALSVKPLTERGVTEVTGETNKEAMDVDLSEDKATPPSEASAGEAEEVVGPGSSSTHSAHFDFALMWRTQDKVNGTPWVGIGFTGDGEYCWGGASNITAHNIYIWERTTGTLNKILEGPKEPLMGLDWDPTGPRAASVSSNGNINLWSTPKTEIWSAYAPGFEELEENQEYEEQEDEFDVEDEDEASRRKQDEEEGIVDIYPPGLLNAVRMEQLERRKARQAALRGPSHSLSAPKLQEALASEAEASGTEVEAQAQARSAAMISVGERPALHEGVQKLRETNAWITLAEVSRDEGEQGFWRDTASEHLQTVLQIGKRVTSVVESQSQKRKEGQEEGAMHVDGEEEGEEQIEEERLVEIVDQDENKAFFLSVRLEEEPYELGSDDERL